MSSTRRLRNDLINAAELHQVFGRDAQRLGGNIAFSGVAPHDGGTALRRNHRINRVFQHQDPVGYGDGQRAAASSFACNRSDDRDFQPRHLPQTACDGFGLSALFGTEAGISSRSIYESKNWAVKFLCELHHRKGFAIDLRIGLAKVAVNTRLDVAALLVAQYNHLFPVKTGYTTDESGVVAEKTVSVNFTPVGKDALNVVECIRTLRMTGQLRLLPCVHVGVELLAQRTHLFLEFLQAGKGFPVFSRARLVLPTLPFYHFVFTPCLFILFPIWVPLVKGLFSAGLQ